jgi:hypothetical protein
MGGRGSASGVSIKGIQYGNEYRTIIASENIRFIEYNLGNTTSPWESMSATENRVYVLVTNFGKLKSIVFFDKEGKRSREIHLDHYHENQQPHVHEGYEHPVGTVPLTSKEKEYIQKITKIWKDYTNGK